MPAPAPCPRRRTPLAALTNQDGYWALDLGLARTATGAPFVITSTTRVLFDLVSESQGIVQQERAIGEGWPFNTMTTAGSHQSLSFHASWNAIALSIVPGRTLTLVDAVWAMNGDGTSRLVAVYRYTGGRWQGVLINGMELYGELFELEPGVGYFFQLTQPAQWYVLGYSVPAAIPLELESGWNLISAPAPANLTASSLTEDFGMTPGSDVYRVPEIAAWQIDQYVGHVAGFPFNNFAINPGAGYFLRATSPVTVTPGE